MTTDSNECPRPVFTEEILNDVLEERTISPLNVHVDFVDLLDVVDDLAAAYDVVATLKDLLS